MAFGDLFLEDVRRYREIQPAGTDLMSLFPLRGLPTDVLARDVLKGGLRARLTCVDPKQIPAMFAGRDFDEGLLAELPVGADPCGERSKFHAFTYAGPMFDHPVPIQSGEMVTRDGFVFVDLF